MKHEYNYTKEGCSLYPQSQHYENISEANNSVLASTSNRLDETGELRLNAQMDYAVMKLYAERVLRKNLQAQAEKLQQTNVNLTIEKTAAIYERDTMTKKYSESIAFLICITIIIAIDRLRYRNFAVSLKKVLKRNLRNIIQMIFDHIQEDCAHSSSHWLDLPSGSNVCQQKVIFERILIRFKSHLLQSFLRWRDNAFNSQPLSDHRQMEIHPDSIFDYSVRSISPRGNSRHLTWLCNRNNYCRNTSVFKQRNHLLKSKRSSFSVKVWSCSYTLLCDGSGERRESSTP